MKKYLQSIAKDMVEKCKKIDSNSREMSKTKNTKMLDDAAAKAIQPLMNYLTENIIRFREWLCEVSFCFIFKIDISCCLQGIWRKDILHMFRIN